MIGLNNLKVKVCILGDSFVGKTCLVRRYVMDIFDNSYTSTFGAKISKKLVLIRRPDQNFNLTLSMWDILGMKDFKNINKMAFQGAKGALLVCDFTQKRTLTNICTWISQLKNVTGEIPMVLLANKSDLTDKYEFSQSELESAASELDMPFFIVSAKSGENVIKTFFKLSDIITHSIFNGNSTIKNQKSGIVNAAA